MKKILPLLILLSAEISFAANLTLYEALKSSNISHIIHGNSASTHYLEPIVLELTNKSSEPYRISVETGDMFIPDNTALQNIVITATDFLSLKPNSTQKFKLKGMCTESHDGSGNDKTAYTFQSSQNPKLKQLCDFISTKKYQTAAAQNAVWTLMNNDDLNNIYAADTLEENNLIRFMAALVGKKIPAKNPNDYRNNYHATTPVQSVSGELNYSFSRTQDIQIAMFNSRGVLVRELVNKKKVTPGRYTQTYQFDSSVYPEDVYQIKLIMNNEIALSQKWDKTDW
jgi:hypothetical protein